MDFVTIDFETATCGRDNPCEVGLTFVEGNVIKETKSWLIKPQCYPHFDQFCVSIHVIQPKECQHSSAFPDIWTEILPLIKDKLLLAHNASFDFSVIRATLDLYHIPHSDLTYGCTCTFSKVVWAGLPMYGLEHLCNLHSIPLIHHRAGSDSEATAKLALKLFAEKGISNIQQISDVLNLNLGKIYSGGYIPCGKRRQPRPYVPGKKISAKDIIADSAKLNQDSIFFERNVAVTGKLSSMTRAEAFQVIADIGGIPSDAVTKNTDFLIVGQQDFRIVGQEGVSSKQRKALEYVDKGLPIEILSENDFLQNI
jgi:DNA polymerase-3 subunit epsilon